MIGLRLPTDDDRTLSRRLRGIPYVNGEDRPATAFDGPARIT
jgi:hypothetical protein